MRGARVTNGAVLATFVATPYLGAQSLAERVGAVTGGTVQVMYAARPDACGDGGDAAALGRKIGSVRAVITRRDGDATFWLGQSRDPRATKYLEERISK